MGNARAFGTPYYPVFLDIHDKLCIIIGGGIVAERKARMLIRFHARVRVVSPKISKGIAMLQEKKAIEVVGRDYNDDDILGASLVFAATNDKTVNNRIRGYASANRIPVNIVDSPDLCDFIVPSVVQKGPITVAISTSGILPLLSKKLRKDLEKHISHEYVRYARIVGKLRRLIMETVPEASRRRKIIKSIGKMGVGEVLKTGFKGMKGKFLG